MQPKAQHPTILASQRQASPSIAAHDGPPSAFAALPTPGPEAGPTDSVVNLALWAVHHTHRIQEAQVALQRALVDVALKRTRELNDLTRQLFSMTRMMEAIVTAVRQADLKATEPDGAHDPMRGGSQANAQADN
jgi:hypothetical protein